MRGVAAKGRSVMEIYLTLLSNSDRFDQCHLDVVPYEVWVENVYKSNYDMMDPNTQMAYALFLGEHKASDTPL